jgi:peptidyl-prolyl cis-trans isomerase C
MTSHFTPAKPTGSFKSALVIVAALALGSVPLAANAQDASSSAPAAAAPAAPAAPAPAPVQPKPTDVVATVGGETITEADLAYAAEDIGQDLQQVPQDQIRAVLLAQMIDLKLMAEAGKTAKVTDTDDYKQRLTYLTDRALRRAYTNQAVGSTITLDDIKAAYDKQVAAMPDVDEVEARHILVTTEDDAKAIKAQLDGGADFATLAKEKSIEPGAKDSGGELGYFTQDKMVKPFADAAFAMKVGEVSQPIQTQFGWHIIKVEDRRKAAKPTLESLTQQIGQSLYVAKYRALFDQLRKATTIDIPDATLKGQVDAQLNPAPQQ